MAGRGQARSSGRSYQSVLDGDRTAPLDALRAVSDPWLGDDPIDVARYSEGRVTSDGCTFTFEFHVPKGLKQYTVISCYDGEDCQKIGYTWDELRDNDFRLDWCKGCDGGELGGGEDVGPAGDASVGSGN